MSQVGWINVIFKQHTSHRKTIYTFQNTWRALQAVTCVWRGTLKISYANIQIQSAPYQICKSSLLPLLSSPIPLTHHLNICLEMGRWSQRGPCLWLWVTWIQRIHLILNTQLSSSSSAFIWRQREWDLLKCWGGTVSPSATASGSPSQCQCIRWAKWLSQMARAPAANSTTEEHSCAQPHQLHSDAVPHGLEVWYWSVLMRAVGTGPNSEFVVQNKLVCFAPPLSLQPSEGWRLIISKGISPLGKVLP